MTLREYIYSFPRGSRMKAREILASEIGVSASAIKSWELGIRNIKSDYAKLIEIKTGRKVSTHELMGNKEAI